MSFVPLEEIKDKNTIPLAPMLDFLFILLAFFVSLSVTRTSTQEAYLELAKAKGESSTIGRKEEKVIQIAVLENGEYRWLTQLRDHPIITAHEIAQELEREYTKGLLPEDKKKTIILLKIDKKAKWEPILQAMLAIRGCGFEAKPLYVPEKA